MERWLDAFGGEERLEAQPAVAALGAWVHALRGRPEDAERWLASADLAPAEGPLPDGSASPRPWIALVRAALCADGVGQMGRDADDALADLPPESAWRPTALVLAGVAQALRDEREDADATFAAAAEAAQRRGEADTDALATAERALLAATAGDQSAAEQLALRAREVAAGDPVEEHVGRALAHAVAARALLRHGRWDEARHALEAAEALAGPLSHALPWLAVQVRVELGAAHVTLRDRSAAAAQLAECERILALRPDLGSLADAVADLRRQLDGLPGRRRRPRHRADRRRAPAAPAARDASLVPRDRRAALRLAQHDQDPGDLGVPQARRLEPQRRDRAGGRAGAGGRRRHRRRGVHPQGMMLRRSGPRRIGRNQ